MTNPHAPSSAKLLALKASCKAFSQTRWVAMWSMGIILCMGSHTAIAQGVEALEWQPGQSALPVNIISTPHNDVRKLLRQAKYPQALLLVNKQLAINPRDPQMRFWQGYVFEQLGQPDMALQVYLDLTREYPELAEPFNNLGVLYAAKGDYPSAKAALENALRANTNYAAAHENLGDVLVNMARLSYERSLAISPNQRPAAKKLEQLQPVLDITQGKP